MDVATILDGLDDEPVVKARPDDQRHVQRIVGLIQRSWAGVVRQLADEFCRERSCSYARLVERRAAIIREADTEWRRIVRRHRDDIAEELDHAIEHGLVAGGGLRANAGRDSVRLKLRRLASAWFTAWANTLIERRLAPKLERLVETLDATATANEVQAGLIEVLGSVPDAVDDLVQPLFRNILSFGILLSAKVPVQRSESERLRKQGTEYNIVPLPEACPICIEIATAGPYSLDRGLERLDDFLDLVDEGDILSGLRDESAFATLDDVAGLTGEEIETAGYIVPPFH